MKYTLIKMMRMGWPLVLLAAIIGGGVGYAVTFIGKPAYTAKATLYVAPPTTSSPTDAVMGDQYAANRTQLYLQLATSDELAQRAAAELQSSQSPSELSSRIKATGVHEAPLLIIEATGSTAQDASALAKAYVDQFPEYARTVEQNSGLREGPVLVPVAGPVEVGKTTGGWKPWLKVILPAVVLGAVAIAFVAWFRQRSPTARNLSALRKAMPESFVEEVSSDPAKMGRLHAMLFAAPGSPRELIFAGARQGDKLEAFTEEFAASLDRANIHYEHVHDGQLDSARGGLGSNDVVILDAPALLEASHRIAPLAASSSAAVIVARRHSLVSDIVEMAKLLGLNGINVRGVVSVHGGGGGTAPTGRANTNRRADSGSGGDPWPKIDVLESATAPRKRSKAVE